MELNLKHHEKTVLKSNISNNFCNSPGKKAEEPAGGGLGITFHGLVPF